MPIPESQLDIWAKQGSITQSSDTYAPIKTALEAATTKYAGTACKVFLQGSYGNDTNIRSESDVDIVIRSDASFYYNLDALTLAERTAFANTYQGSAAYGYSAFKEDVIAALKARFGNDAEMGKKAMRIKANGSRRDADVVIAAEFRRYIAFPDPAGERCHYGICFFDSTGTRIENFPVQHRVNCTAKHAATNEWFKPAVRILKNLRTKLVNDGVIGGGIAPSYFLEGLLYNVPNEKFGVSYEDTIVEAINWIRQADRTKFVTPSGLHWLVQDALESWPTANCNSFLTEAIKLWQNW